jgi:hopanoid biosynthesis associated RND transporter like protein HpnN
MRAAIAELPSVRDGSAHVRITGGVALADEEFGTVARGMLVGTLASIGLITLWLVLALRSWRLIVPILATLLLGLSLTAGFAAAAVGTLNVVSLAFAILFVGIAVDFAIQVAVRFRERLFLTGETAAALEAVALDVGPEVAVAAAATACGFLAFVPTDFAGVAELGLIAGVGMLIAFACTFAFMPAVLTLLRPRPEPLAVGLPGGEALEGRLTRARKPVLVGFAVLALAGAALLPGLTFDSDPLHTKDASTEAMRTLADLMASPLTDPYSVEVLAPSLQAADALAARLHPQPSVADVLTLSSFVPTQQADKLALIADAADILGPTLAPRSPAAPVDAAGLRLAAQSTERQLSGALAKLPPDDPLRAIAGDLHVLAAAPDAVLLAANAALVRFLPEQIARLRLVLDAHPVTLADVPPEIARDWVLPDGRARAQVLGTAGTRSSRGLRALVAGVQAVAPDAQGSAVTIVESADTIIGAFRSAALSALVAIALILAVALRRVRDVALVMAPLLLSSLLTVLAVRLAGLSLNFANIIALPLLLGVGVSFNVYFVMDWRAGAPRFLGTATARAIVFSALTTSSAFGSLALSGHPGTASMGTLLLLSLGATLVGTLLFLPPLLLSVRARRG